MVHGRHTRLVIQSRQRPHRWLLPFSRELSMGGISQAPLLPWAWKMALMRAWLARGFFGPAGLAHMMPRGDASHMDYAGAPASLPTVTEQDVQDRSCSRRVRCLHKVHKQSCQLWLLGVCMRFASSCQQQVPLDAGRTAELPSCRSGTARSCRITL